MPVADATKENGSGAKKRKRSRSGSSSSSSSDSDSEDEEKKPEVTASATPTEKEEEEEEDKPEKVDEEEDKIEKTEDVTDEAAIEKSPEEKSEATADNDDSMEQDKTDGEIKDEPKKEESSSTAAEATEIVDLVKDKSDSASRALHKTSSIFLRNLAPTITKAEVEAVCRRYDGYLRVAIADPLVERRWFRRGWVSFRRDVNIKEICWNLNNIRVSGSLFLIVEWKCSDIFSKRRKEYSMTIVLPISP